MAQSTLMYYAYFRFYVDESEIIAGMDKFCTGWEKMFAVGYNYIEYKCFVDNLGGFEHWVGDMRGYISQTRETGFMDGAPSDAVYDTSLLMGAQKITDDDLLVLNSVPRGKTMYFRRITAQDAGIAHKFKLSCGDAVITHPCMYTLDLSQIEILTPEAAIVDDSDVTSYEFVVDTPNAWLKGGVEESKTCGTTSNIDNMFDRDKATYGRFLIPPLTTCEMILNMGEKFDAIAMDIHNHNNAPYFGATTLYTSPDKMTWTQLAYTGFSDVRAIYGDNNLTNIQYIKIKHYANSGNSGACDIYRILCS